MTQNSILLNRTLGCHALHFCYLCRYQEQLQKNLMYLAAIADNNAQAHQWRPWWRSRCRDEWAFNILEHRVKRANHRHCKFATGSSAAREIGEVSILWACWLKLLRFKTWHIKTLRIYCAYPTHRMFSCLCCAIARPSFRAPVLYNGFKALSEHPHPLGFHSLTWNEHTDAVHPLWDCLLSVISKISLFSLPSCIPVC